MTIKEFNQKYLLDFKVNEYDPINLEFTINTIDRKTLQPTLDIKRERLEVPVEWLMDKMDEEFENQRNPDTFRTQFYGNTKRKLINNILLKNNIKGFDALQLDNDISFLFQ